MTSKTQLTKKEHLLQVIKNSGEKGIKSEAASKAVDQSISNIQRAIFGLRKEGYAILYDKDKKSYIYGSHTNRRVRSIGKKNKRRKTSPKTPTIEGTTLISSVGYDAIRTPSLKNKDKIRALTKSNQQDYFDFMHKAVFYKLCAKAVLNTVEIIYDLERSILA